MKKNKIISLFTILLFSTIVQAAMPCYDEFNAGYNLAYEQYSYDYHGCSGIYASFCQSEAYAVFQHNLDLLQQQFDDCMK